MSYYITIPFCTEDSAKRVAEWYSNSFVEQTERGSWQVVVGPYETHEEASSVNTNFGVVIEQRNTTMENNTFNWSRDDEYTVNNWPSEYIGDNGRTVVYKWGHTLSTYSGFLMSTGEMVWSSGGVMHPLVPKPKFEDRAIYNLEYTELESLNSRFLKQESERSYFGYNTFELNLMDSRGYKYCVQFGTSRPTPHRLSITAGCQSWSSFEEARNHYDENYDSDGNRHEVLKMLEVLEGWYTAICEDKKPKPTLWEMVKEKAPSSNCDEPFLVDLSFCTQEGHSDNLRVVYDKDDLFQTMALGFGYDEHARWLTKEMATNLRDMLSEAIDDWGGNDDDSCPF